MPGRFFTGLAFNALVWQGELDLSEFMQGLRLGVSGRTGQKAFDAKASGRLSVQDPFILPMFANIHLQKNIIR